MSDLNDLAFALERSFLASEFLTWLWFRCEVEGGVFDLPSGGVSVAVEDGLSLASWEDDGLKASLRGGNPTTRPEAANALASGLMLRKARLILARAGKEWLFSLDGTTLDLLGVKCVFEEDDDEDEAADALADKLAAGEELRLAIDELYAQFLGVRLGESWTLEQRRLKDWVRTKLSRAAEKIGAA